MTCLATKSTPQIGKVSIAEKEPTSQFLAELEVPKSEEFRHFADKFFIATSLRSVEQAFELVTAAYEQQDYIDPQEGNLHFDPRLLSEHAKILVTHEGPTIDGTLSILKYSRYGLPSTNVFTDKIDELVSQGKSIAELTHFAFAPSTSRNFMLRPVPLLYHALLQAKQDGIDTLVSVVNPSHLEFWLDKVGFNILARERPCPHVKGKPGVLLTLDISAPLELLGANSRLIRREVALHKNTLNLQRDRDFPLTNEEIKFLLDRAPAVRDLWKSKLTQEIPEWLQSVLVEAPNTE